MRPVVPSRNDRRLWSRYKGAKFEPFKESRPRLTFGVTSMYSLCSPTLSEAFERIMDDVVE